MRRVGGLLLIIVVAAACTPEGAEPPNDVIASEASSVEPTSDASASVTPSPELTLEPTQTCDGLGRAPSRGEITFVRNGKLIGASPDGTGERCLAELDDLDTDDVPRPMAWNAPANRVLIHGQALSRDLTATDELAPAETAVWSRPTGTSVVWITADGRLMKRSSFGGPATDISFLARHDDVTYHPAGTHIATSGLKENGDYGLFLATNIGTKPKLLARGEEARYITNLEFAHRDNILYYTARHGRGDWHLHALLMGRNSGLTTLDRHRSNMSYVVDSFDEHDDVAWSLRGDCAAGEPDRLKIDMVIGTIKVPARLRQTSLRPIGWLYSDRLVVASSPVSCGTAAPQDIYVLSDKEPVRLVEEIGSTAAVRAALPPPPPPPGEEQEVVA